MMDSRRVHLGCDTGEAVLEIERQRELQLLRHMDAVHIACGGHAGDQASMTTAIIEAVKQGCTVGAHPSYPDREGFGRRDIDISRSQLGSSLRAQLLEIQGLAAQNSTRIQHIKAHGALYHRIAEDTELALWFWQIASNIIEDAALVLPLGSVTIHKLRSTGAPVLIEGFCDRVYEANGTLRSRHQPDALISDPQDAIAQADRLVFDTECDLLCVHADTPNAGEIASAVSAHIRGL